VTEALCRCKRPIHDTAYVCSVCTGIARRVLDELRHYVGEATITIGRLDRVRRRGTAQPQEGVDDGWHKGEGALYPTRNPIDPARAKRYDAAVNALSTWARHIAEERGQDIPPWRHYALTCDHGRCAWVHAGLAVGVTCALRLSDHPLSTVAMWLRDNLTWLAHRQEAQEALDEITDACREIEHVIDTTEGETIVGRCPCGTWLYAKGRATSVRCGGCGTSYAADSRLDLLRQARDRTVTAIEAAELIAGYVDPGVDRTRVRKLIWTWADRGLIEVVDGSYTLGPILDRWTRALAARVA
jgi:hypothetical protein